MYTNILHVVLCFILALLLRWCCFCECNKKKAKKTWALLLSHVTNTPRTLGAEDPADGRFWCWEGPTRRARCITTRDKERPNLQHPHAHGSSGVSVPTAPRDGASRLT